MTSLSSLIFFLLCFFSLGPLASSTSGIHWHQGSVQSAFLLAKKENKPLFLYWGAAWCPPCNQIKRTIFSKPQFQSIIKKFIPVYLDGDKKRAQIWSERFGTVGYPTMIILSPQGVEVNRLPTGLQVDEYTSLMSKSILKMRPISELLELALQKKLKKKEDWQLLSSHSWHQEKKMETFKILYQNCPSSFLISKSRLLLQYLSLVKKLSTKEQFFFKEKFLNILTKKSLLYSNLESLFFQAENFITVLFSPRDIHSKEFIKTYLNQMKIIEADSTLSIDERLSSLSPAISLHKVFNKKAPYSKNFKRHILKISLWASENSKNQHQRQAAMSTAIWNLKETGQLKQAIKLSKEEILKSESPFYFMSYLGSLYKKIGNKSLSIDWYEKAYISAKGEATKFQWGTRYALAIIELFPKNIKRLQKHLKNIMNDISKSEGAFHGRNQLRFSQLSKGLKKWGKTRKSQIVAVKDQLKNHCQFFLQKKKCLEWSKII